MIHFGVCTKYVSVSCLLVSVCVHVRAACMSAQLAMRDLNSGIPVMPLNSLRLDFTLFYLSDIQVWMLIKGQSLLVQCISCLTFAIRLMFKVVKTDNYHLKQQHFMKSY